MTAVQFIYSAKRAKCCCPPPKPIPFDGWGMKCDGFGNILLWKSEPSSIQYEFTFTVAVLYEHSQEFDVVKFNELFVSSILVASTGQYACSTSRLFYRTIELTDLYSFSFTYINNSTDIRLDRVSEEYAIVTRKDDGQIGLLYNGEYVSDLPAIPNNEVNPNTGNGYCLIRAQSETLLFYRGQLVHREDGRFGLSVSGNVACVGSKVVFRDGNLESENSKLVGDYIIDYSDDNSVAGFRNITGETIRFSAQNERLYHAGGCSGHIGIRVETIGDNNVVTRRVTEVYFEGKRVDTVFRPIPENGYPEGAPGNIIANNQADLYSDFCCVSVTSRDAGSWSIMGRIFYYRNERLDFEERYGFPENQTDFVTSGKSWLRLITYFNGQPNHTYLYYKNTCYADWYNNRYDDSLPFFVSNDTLYLVGSVYANSGSPFKQNDTICEGEKILIEKLEGGRLTLTTTDCYWNETLEHVLDENNYVIGNRVHIFSGCDFVGTFILRNINTQTGQIPRCLSRGIQNGCSTVIVTPARAFAFNENMQLIVFDERFGMMKFNGDFTRWE